MLLHTKKYRRQLKNEGNSEKYRKKVKVENPGKKRYNSADIRREITYETIIFGM